MTVNTHIPTGDEIENMTARQHRSLEARCRRAADRRDLHMIKSRRRDTRAIDYGAYWLSDVDNWLVSPEIGMNLVEVAEYLWGDDTT
jgi:hypothetical protein